MIRDPVVFMDEQLNLSFLQTFKTSGSDNINLKYINFYLNFPFLQEISDIKRVFKGSVREK